MLCNALMMRTILLCLFQMIIVMAVTHTTCWQVTDQGLQGLLPLGEVMTELVMKGLEYITDEGVAVLQSLVVLTKLDIW